MDAIPGNGAGITLRGLGKTYRTPQGPVEAVRDVDAHVVWARRWRCSARTARGSRRRSTCSSGCAALGILLGHVLTTDSIGPAIGGLTALFALLGGVWFPVTRRSA